MKKTTWRKRKKTVEWKKRTNTFQDYGVSEDGGMKEEDHYFPN